jgi:copper chaperone CopZ
LSRPKKMLPVVGQTPPRPEVPHGAPSDETDACCGTGKDECCEGEARLTAVTPQTREANPEALDRDVTLDELERTVVRVEGMDCASCAATVEKCVSQRPGMHRVVVNFAAGRLDAEHDPGLALEEIEEAIREAGYGVARPTSRENSLLAHHEGTIGVRLRSPFRARARLGACRRTRGRPRGRLPRSYRCRRVADLPGCSGGREGPAPGHERADERRHDRRGGDRGVG